MEILHPCGSKAEPGSLISEVPESAILCRSSDDKHQVEKSRCDALFISVQQTDAIQVAVIDHIAPLLKALQWLPIALMIKALQDNRVPTQQRPTSSSTPSPGRESWLVKTDHGNPTP